MKAPKAPSRVRQFPFLYLLVLPVLVAFFCMSLIQGCVWEITTVTDCGVLPETDATLNAWLDENLRGESLEVVRAGNSITITGEIHKKSEDKLDRIPWSELGYLSAKPMEKRQGIAPRWLPILATGLLLIGFLKFGLFGKRRRA